MAGGHPGWHRRGPAGRPGRRPNPNLRSCSSAPRHPGRHHRRVAAGAPPCRRETRPGGGGGGGGGGKKTKKKKKKKKKTKKKKKEGRGRLPSFFVELFRAVRRLAQDGPVAHHGAPVRRDRRPLGRLIPAPRGACSVCGHTGHGDRAAFRPRPKRPRCHFTGSAGVAHHALTRRVLRDALLRTGAPRQTLETATLWFRPDRPLHRGRQAITKSMDRSGHTPVVLCHISHVTTGRVPLLHRSFCNRPLTRSPQVGKNRQGRGQAGHLDHGRAPSPTIPTPSAPTTLWVDSRGGGSLALDALRAVETELGSGGHLNPESSAFGMLRQGTLS